MSTTNENPYPARPHAELGAVGYSILIAEHFGIKVGEEWNMHSRLRAVWERIEATGGTHEHIEALGHLVAAGASAEDLAKLAHAFASGRVRPLLDGEDA